MFLLNSFSDYYNSPISLNILNSSNIRYFQLSGDSIVIFCLFFSLIITSNGGAISFSEINCRLMINECSFHNCGTTGSTNYGGAIDFSNSLGQIIIKKVCGHSCFSNSVGYPYGYQFSRQISNINGFNFLIYSSIIMCSPIPNEREITVGFSNGIQNIISTNFSKNNPKYHSCFWSFGCTNFFTNYSLFISNQMTWISLYFWSNSLFSFFSCNIINNSQLSNSYGIITNGISGEPILIFDSCCFYQNALTGSKILFCFYSGNLQILNTGIDIYSFSSRTPSTINIYSFKNTLLHTFMNTFLCFGNNNIFSFYFLKNGNLFIFNFFIFIFLIFTYEPFSQ